MKREVKIGIFGVTMIIAAWAGIRFLKGFDIFSRNSVYYAAYDQIKNPQPRVNTHKVWRSLNTDEVAEPNVFAVDAVVAAYDAGAEWFDALRGYIYDNKKYAEEIANLDYRMLKLRNKIEKIVYKETN